MGCYACSILRFTRKVVWIQKADEPVPPDYVVELINWEKIALNFTDVPYVDSASLGEIVRCYVAVGEYHGELEMLHLGQRFRKLLSFSDDDDCPTGAAGATSLGAIFNIKPPS